MPSPEQLLWDPPIAGQPNRLRASRCESCGRHEFPATERCPVCGAGATAVALAAVATLGPRTAVLHAPPGAQIDVPYVVGVARFPEGISVLGLIDVPDLDAAPTGSGLDTVALEPSSGLVTYAFRPR